MPTISTTTKNWITTILFTAFFPALIYLTSHPASSDTWANWRPITFAAAGILFTGIVHSYSPQSGAKGERNAEIVRMFRNTQIDGSKLQERGCVNIGQIFALAAFTVVVFFASLLAGCMSSAPIVPVTPANQAQISSCQNTARLHNGFVFGDFGLGAIGAGTGAAAAVVGNSNSGVAMTLAIVAGIAGALTAGDTGLSELTASNFLNSQCASVVGPLPAANTEHDK